MPGRFHVGGKVVDHVDLLRKRHWLWRLDVWPFAILYAAWIVAVVPSLDFGDATIVLGGIVALHILVFLFTVWSVDFGCFVKYSKVCGIFKFAPKNYTCLLFSGALLWNSGFPCCGPLIVLLSFRTKNAVVMFLRDVRMFLFGSGVYFPVWYCFFHMMQEFLSYARRIKASNDF